MKVCLNYKVGVQLKAASLELTDQNIRDGGAAAFGSAYELIQPRPDGRGKRRLLFHRQFRDLRSQWSGIQCADGLIDPPFKNQRQGEGFNLDVS